MYRAIGLIATILCLWAIFDVLRKTKIDLSHSISHHAARDPKTHLRFAVTMTLGILLFGIFGLGWFAPYFNMPWVFTTIFTLALLLELATAWIPLTHGWKFTAHQVASYGTALLIPVLLAFIALSDTFSTSAVYLSAICTLLILTFIFMFLFVKSQRKYYLTYQTIYVVCFFVGILGASFFS